MYNPLAKIRRCLSAKILIVLSVCVAFVMGWVIVLAVVSQQRHLLAQMTSFGHKLQSIAHAAIKHPMALGDSAAIDRQLLAIRDQLAGSEIIVCDFDQIIVFSSHGEQIGEPMTSLTGSGEFIVALQELLSGQDGGSVPGHFEEVRNGRRYLLTLDAIDNQPECYECHGSSRRVLGGLITRHSTDGTYAAITALRNRTIGISLMGIAAVVLLTYLLLARLVTRPLEELAAKAGRLAGGDLEVAVTVGSEDAVGLLGRSFNIMVSSIKDQIGYFNSLRDAIAAPLFIVNNDMLITYMNEACARLTGFSREETEGRLSCRQVFRSDHCGTTCPLRCGRDDNTMREGITATLTDRQGDLIPVMVSASALEDARGIIIGAVEICKDVSEVIQAERLRYLKETAVREEEQRRYLEARVGELLGTLSQVSAGNLKVRAMEQGRGDVMDQVARHINLSLDNLEELYARISSFSREMEREVDRRTMLLREKTLLLERANRELRELDKLKSAFLANMSHELRTPMNSIIGYTDLLLDGVDGRINEEQEKSLGKVQQNARHLLQLINDILDMAKIESGKIALDPAQVHLGTLAAAVATIFEPTVTGKGLALTLDIGADLPLVHIDEDKVRQIFINLLSNAVKFTNRGSIVISIRPFLAGSVGEQPPQFLQVCVADTGIGIRAEHLGKLFDKFSQIDSSTVRHYEGTGLGLSIARGLVVLHKGKIWATSTFGKGSTFCFTLPTDGKLLEKPVRAEIEPAIAEVLAQYYERPAAIFLQGPRYGGRPVKCWEFTHCSQTSCPAHGSEELRCWLIPGTHCRGTRIAECSEKVDFCRSCEIIELLILGQAEAEAAAAAAGDDLPPAIGARDRRTVLVIDDNPEVVELVGKYIGGEYQVVGLLSGEAAVARAVELKPVAITLDIMMPGKDGWQVLYELKQNPATQEIPVVILSIVDNKKLGFSLGAAEYIVKPIDKNFLLRKLHSLEKIASIRRILVVDSDARTVGMVRDLLEGSGYQSAGAMSSREAIAAMEVSPPDLIVLNPIMPAADGLDVIERLKANRQTRNTPIILLTQQMPDEKDLENLNGHIRAILNKRILTEEAWREELVETIRKVDSE
jgi:PAS domain S-box-containing protein